MKIVCMGDSLTEGYEMDLSKRWSKELAKASGLEVINSGICGDTTGGMLARFKTMVLDYEPTHLIIMGGTNDVFVGVPNEVINSNILAMTRYARYHGIQAIVGIPLAYNVQALDEAERTEVEYDRQARIESMRRCMRDYFMDDEMPVIEFASGLALEDYQRDGCHPNEAGHYKMMETVKAFIEKI